MIALFLPLHWGRIWALSLNMVLWGLAWAVWDAIK